MGAIKDIVDLATQLESRVKERRDIDVLRQIHSLASSLQSEHAEVVERDVRVMQENAKLMQEKAQLEQQLAAAQAEDIQINKGIEFRRGKRTGNKWMGFCPKCHMPSQDAWIPNGRLNEKVVMCTARCGWQVFMQPKLDDIAKEITT